MVQHRWQNFPFLSGLKKSEKTASHVTKYMHGLMGIVFALLAILGCQPDFVDGKLIEIPRDTEVKANHSTYFNCSTNHGPTAIFWFHGTNYVYTGSTILDPYHERFDVDRFDWNGTYTYNLVIHSVQPGDAGEYICAEDEGVGEKYSIQLIVFDALSDNSTRNTTLDDEIQCKAHTSQSCTYKWKWLQDNDFTIESSTSILKAKKLGWHRCEAKCNLRNISCNLLVMRALVYGEAESIQTSQRRIIIISVVVTVVVAVVLAGAFICILLNIVRKRGEAHEVTIRRYGDNLVEMESFAQPSSIYQAAHEVAKSEGSVADERLHIDRQEKETDVMVPSELLEQPVIDVIGHADASIGTTILEKHKDSKKRHSDVIEYADAPTGTTLLAEHEDIKKRYSDPTGYSNALIVIDRAGHSDAQRLMELLEEIEDLKKGHRVSKSYSNASSQTEVHNEIELLGTLHQDIYGIAILDREMFILHNDFPDRSIEVYELSTFAFKRRITVDGMTLPTSIASCFVSKCLYASDCNYHSKSPAILRIDPVNGSLINTWNIYGGRISIASDTHVIIIAKHDIVLYEYTADGELVRKINLRRFLGADFLDDLHAVKLPSGLFVVGHGYNFEPQSKVYLLSLKKGARTRDGFEEFKILKTYNVAEKKDLVFRSGKRVCVSVSKKGLILFSCDSDNQAVLLSANLKKLQILVSEEHEMGSRLMTCFDESTSQWFVANSSRVMVCRVRDN